MKQSFTDQMGHSITINFPPKRIVSLVPSQTELLFYFGLEKEVVGITKFCVHPPEQFKSKPRIGGTKNFHFDRIEALQPDLIIGNKEENQKEHIEQLQTEYSVWMSDIKTLADAFEMILKLGQLTNKQSIAEKLVAKLKVDFQKLSDAVANQRNISVAYLIWQKPFMVAANDTFINHMLKLAGFNNVFHNKERYPSVSEEELRETAPEVLLLSSEPFPFKEKHIADLQKICPNTVIKLVDGEIFSWYGNRLLFAVPYFLNLRKQLFESL